jgi:hypothetical protein
MKIMDTTKNRFQHYKCNKRKRFYPIYCAQKGTSKKIIFKSSLIFYEALFLAG